MHTTLPVRVALLKAQVEAMKAAAEHAFPAECCGLLVGHCGDAVIVTQVVAAANIADDPRRRFLIDPQVQFDLLRELRGSDQRIVGHYHSHPNGNAALSHYDLAMADDPQAIWVVLATDGAGRAQPPIAFRAAATGAMPVAIEVIA